MYEDEIRITLEFGEDDISYLLDEDGEIKDELKQTLLEEIAHDMRKALGL